MRAAAMTGQDAQHHPGSHEGCPYHRFIPYTHLPSDLLLQL